MLVFVARVLLLGPSLLPPSPSPPLALCFCPYPSCFWVCVSAAQNSICVHQKKIPPHVSIHSPSALQPDSNYFQTPVNHIASAERPDPCHVGVGGLKIDLLCLFSIWSHREGLATMDHGDVTSPKPPDVLRCDICSFCTGVGCGENIRKRNPLLPGVPRLVSIMALSCPPLPRFLSLSCE